MMPRPLALSAASALIASHRNAYERDDELLRYMRDLHGSFGVEIREELLEHATNVSFTDLGERVLRAIPPPAWPPDLLIVTYGLPDCQPLKTVSSHLDYLLGGARHSFAISEQGLAAPFTALRIANAYARAGRCQSLALFVLEQTTFPYWMPLVHETPLADSGVVLLLEQDGERESTFEASELRRGANGLAALLSELDGTLDHKQTLLVTGPWPEPAELEACPLPCHRAAKGSYCTSVWLELARHHQEWATRYDALVLCDTDPRSGLSHAAVMINRNGT